VSTPLYRIWLHEGVTLPVRRPGIDPGFSENTISVANRFQRQAFLLSLEKVDSVPFVVITHAESKHQTHIALSNVKALEVLTAAHEAALTDPKRKPSDLGLVDKLR
jgi:L-ascorbate metabolism protein UlaG (beta-lactamase superfamily)